MKFFKRFLCVSLALTMTLLAFAACGEGTEQETNPTSDTPSASVTTTDVTTTEPVTTTPTTTAPTTTAPTTTAPVTTTEPANTEPPETDPPETTPTETDPPETTPTEEELTPLAPSLNEALGRTVSATHVAGSGALVSRYQGCLAADFRTACAYYESLGYKLYCEDATTGTLSATYIKGNAYCALFLNIKPLQLYVTTDEKNGNTFPEHSDQNYEKICDVTVTAPKTTQQGLCDIFRLEDGSFLLFDSSGNGAHETIWQTLCQLNGSDQNIHIRAWVLTHTHGDHYGGFLSFAPVYGDKVTIDTVFYAPVNRDVMKTIASYGTSWDTIDYYFNDTLPSFVRQYYPTTDLCPVFAGQIFHLPGADLQILYSCELLYIDRIPVNVNHTSLVCMVSDQNGSMLVMADSEEASTNITMEIYRGALDCDILQLPHHGMSRKHDVTLANYAVAKIILIPCTVAYFNSNSNQYTRQIMNMTTTKATYIMGEGTVTLLLSGEKVG